MLAGEPLVIRAWAGGYEALGGNYELVPPSLYCLAHNMLGHAGVVCVGCIYEVDTLLVGGVDYRQRPRVFHVSSSEHICAQTEPGYFEAGPA